MGERRRGALRHDPGRGRLNPLAARASTAPLDLAADVRDRLFRSADPSVLRLGLEAEVLPLEAATGEPCALERDPAERDRPALGPMLRRWVAERGWTTTCSPAGAPAFLVPGGGVLSFEPGGQLEYSSVPRAGLDTLLDDAESVLAPLARRAADEGIRFLARGMDPVTPVDRTRLQLGAERYRRMTAHYDRSGPAGRRMMRQTAALHLNLDFGTRPAERWAVANALAPLLIAIFANSSRADGQDSGHRSARALQWRRLDPARTGIFPPSGDPPEAYLAFALAAPAFLLGPEDEPARPFRDWWRAGMAGVEDWKRHLTTLFPEVRPRGYLEVRSVDALPLRWYGAPLALVAGILQDERALAEALAALPPAGTERLERAGRVGLADPEIAALVAVAFDLADQGLGRGAAPGAARGRDVLRAFRSTLTARGLDPAAGVGEDLLD